MTLNETFRLTLRLNETVETKGRNVHYLDRHAGGSSNLDRLEVPALARADRLKPELQPSSRRTSVQARNKISLQIESHLRHIEPLPVAAKDEILKHDFQAGRQSRRIADRFEVDDDAHGLVEINLIAA